MKKKIFILGLACCLLVWVSIIITLLIKSFTTWAILMLVIKLILLIGVYGLVKYQKHIKNLIVDPKNEMTRNYDRLVVGSIYSKLIDGGSTLDLRNYSRNYYVDSLMIERYYSFVREGGCVELYIERNDKYKVLKKISMLDYPLLHQVTLLEHGISSKWQKYQWFNIVVGYAYLFNVSKKRPSDTKIKVDYTNLFDFCNKRGLLLKVYDEGIREI